MADFDLELEQLLDDLEEFLDDHQDVNDGADGQPVPNRAMSLYTRLITLRRTRLRARQHRAKEA
jgi:hypothetical protein